MLEQREVTFTQCLFHALLLCAVHGSRPFECNPEFNCATCSNPYSCDTCATGTFFHRAGAHFECAVCEDACIACHYYGYCDECVKGRYGKGCEKHCSEGCLSGACEQSTGNCSCKEYFYGGRCDKCTPGRYGLNCMLFCNHGCLYDECDKEVGECECKYGYTGLNCSECSRGRYGNDCQYECSPGCLDGECNQGTGHCECKGNYTGDKCDRCEAGFHDIYSDCSFKCPTACTACESDSHCTECKPGRFGNDCNCTSENGPCQLENDCSTGKYGENCTEDCLPNCFLCSNSTLCIECESGFWTSNCLRSCPANCMNATCDINNGTCTDGCTSGYHGQHCECDEDNICSKFDEVGSSGRAVVCTNMLLMAVATRSVMLIV